MAAQKEKYFPLQLRPDSTRRQVSNQQQAVWEKLWMSGAARQMTSEHQWVVGGNNETLAGMVMKQSAIFIDDGDVHRLGWLQMIVSKEIDFCKAQADPSSSKHRWVW